MKSTIMLLHDKIILIVVILVYLSKTCFCNLPPVFTQDMNNLALSEATPVGTIVYTLEGYDPENSDVTFGLIGSDNFEVNPITGEVKVIKALDHEDTLSFIVTIKDRINASVDSENDNIVPVSISVIVLDENNNAPEFQNVPYETEVLEDALPGQTIFNKILVTDKDTVGDNLNITCLPQIQSPNACKKFSIKLLENNQDRATAAVIVNDKLDYNEQMIYHIILSATDATHTSNTTLEIQVKDVQNSPPMFQGALAAVIDEDSPINTLVMTIHAKDGDRGQPRKIVYDLLTNPMDYFLLDAKTGELRTAKPLDKEALPDATGLITLKIRARELIDGVPGNDPLTSTITQASVTIRDVNDSPPTFNQKNYYVSLPENTPMLTPLPLDMNVHDLDVGPNAIFSLRLDDVSGVFDVEPKLVTGSSQVSIRVANGTLDYENPNQRKFIVLVIAEETETNPKLSSTATLTVSITDTNDNKPIFDQESYSVSVSETANPGHLITTITAKDMDSGHFGDQGIRYALSGTGSNNFNVDPITGAITVAKCDLMLNEMDSMSGWNHLRRKKRDLNHIDMMMDDDSLLMNSNENLNDNNNDNNNNINLTLNSQTGLIDFESNTEFMRNEPTYKLFDDENNDENIYVTTTTTTAAITSTTTTEQSKHDHLNNSSEMPNNERVENEIHHKYSNDNDKNDNDKNNDSDDNDDSNINNTNYQLTNVRKKLIGPGHSPCLDFETQSEYFLSFKATDDDGNGQTSVVSLKITLLDANDSPPVCESALYRASLDEGATVFDPPLIIRARDPDKISDINYSIIGNEMVLKVFTIDKRSGQLFVKDASTLDVIHLNSEIIHFAVEASDGLYTTLCNVNITIRDVNNHAPQFSRDNYMASIAENTPIGTSVEQVNATDLDTGLNAEIRYRIQQGSFDDFLIDNRTGLITIGRKLDYDRRNTYRIEIIGSDMGVPSLSGTATLTINIINSNDKDPYFTPSTQRAEVPEDAPIGTIIHTLIALDPDVSSSELLDYAATEPITAVNNEGKEVTDIDDFKYLFTIDRTGKVIVKQHLNRDQFAVIRITVLVTDTTAPTIQQGKGLLVITIIDVNEQPPLFIPPWSPTSPKYHLQMPEEQQIGSILTTLQATDSDSNIEAYHLDKNDYFDIDNTTGMIWTKSRIDYEQIKEIHLMASVTDTGIPQLTSTTEIIVDIINTNDNDPIFNLTEYNMNVLENSPKGTVVGKVEATDNDDGIFGEIIYSLVGEHSKEFYIEPESGIITVQNGSFLDREREPSISLTAIATDKAPMTTRKSTAVSVHIKVLDVNDNKPIFTQNMYHASVAENAPLNPPAAILQVKALDADDGAFGDIKYFLIVNENDDSYENNLFRIDPDSGILYPMKSLKGLQGQYKLKVEARDGLGSGPFTDTAEIEILIQSINNYRPVFIMPALHNASVELLENLVMENYLVMTVKAFDNDTGDNGMINYYLQINNQNVQETDEFIIDKNTGELRTKNQLDRKTQSKYELILVAKDQGSPASFETLRFLTILLVDINESKPEFPDASNPYKFFVMENGLRDMRIGKIQAMIKEKDSTINIYYYMILGNENSAFYLDKNTGDIYTNQSLDREEIDMYHLYILASKKSDLHISESERAAYSIKSLERDSTIAKVQIVILDVNDNAPIFERQEYFAGVNEKSSINHVLTIINATDSDLGLNGTFDMVIVASNLYKYGATKTTGSIVPSPFAISKDGRLSTASYMAEYNQDRFELDVMAKEVQAPEREAYTKVYVWIFSSDQLVRVILSRPPSEVHQEQEEIIAELQNATQKRIIIDEIRYHVDSMGRIRMDWCDLFFHAVDPQTKTIVPVDDILKVVDSHYDFLKNYYAGFAIENIVPAHSTFVEEEFDLALAGLVALLIVLFVGAISFLVLCCCLRQWSLSIPSEVRRKDALIKKQIVEDLSTTENPLWIEQKLKLYEEQELTMQVFSEPEMNIGAQLDDALQPTLDRRNSYEASQIGDNTYATIQPRNLAQLGEIADYATLRNNSASPSMYEFTGSTFQAPISRDRDDNYHSELI